MEMNSVLWWTPEFETKFLGQWGYDIRGCLPVLVNQENSWAQGHLQYGEGFLSANASIGTKCNHDYRQVLQRGYEEYVQASIDWAHARGVKYSNQPAYNLPLSMVSDLVSSFTAWCIVTVSRATQHFYRMLQRSNPSASMTVSMAIGTCPAQHI